MWWRPAISKDRIYFTSWDCFLYCVDTESHDLVWKFRSQGSPSYVPPPFDSFELTVKKPVEDSGFKEEGSSKRYQMDAGETEEKEQFYKSRITYQISTQYQSRGGKYQVDSDEEEF
jgi:outer membrane protein assembly factor BamB